MSVIVLPSTDVAHQIMDASHVSSVPVTEEQVVYWPTSAAAFDYSFLAAPVTEKVRPGQPLYAAARRCNVSCTHVGVLID